MLKPLQEIDIASEFAFCAEMAPFIHAIRSTREFEQRDAIRRTWLSNTSSLRCVQ